MLLQVCFRKLLIVKSPQNKYGINQGLVFGCVGLCEKGTSIFIIMQEHIFVKIKLKSSPILQRAGEKLYKCYEFAQITRYICIAPLIPYKIIRI